MLSDLIAGRGRILQDEDVVLLLPEGPGWSVRISITPDVIRICTGSASRILVGADEPTTLEPLTDVVVAIREGRAEEYFGTGPGGPLSVIGFRVWYPSGELMALDEGARVEAIHRASPWVGPTKVQR